MFADLISRLTAPRPARLPDADATLALAALLVRLARADGRYDPAEVARIDEVLSRQRGLAPDAARALRLQAEALEAEAPDTVRFTRAIKEAVPHEDREAVLAAMWSVVLADGSRDSEEDSLMRLLANLLGINDRDSALIRQKVESGAR